MNARGQRHACDALHVAGYFRGIISFHEGGGNVIRVSLHGGLAGEGTDGARA